MKNVKNLRNIILVLLGLGAILIVFLLIGNRNDNKLVATKIIENEEFGKYVDEVVIMFEDNRVTSIQESMEFENEETAESLYSMYDFINSMQSDSEQLRIGISGKKIIIMMNAAELEKNVGFSLKEKTEKDMEINFKEKGYNVK